MSNNLSKLGITSEKCCIYVPQEYLEAYEAKNQDLNYTIMVWENTGIANSVQGRFGVKLNNGEVVVSGLKDGETVQFFSLDGQLINCVKSKGNPVSQSVPLGVVIVKVCGRSIKINVK